MGSLPMGTRWGLRRLFQQAQTVVFADPGYGGELATAAGGGSDGVDDDQTARVRQGYGERWWRRGCTPAGAASSLIASGFQRGPIALALRRLRIGK